MLFTSFKADCDIASEVCFLKSHDLANKGFFPHLKRLLHVSLPIRVYVWEHLAVTMSCRNYLLNFPLIKG